MGTGKIASGSETDNSPSLRRHYPVQVQRVFLSRYKNSTPGNCRKDKAY